MIIKVFFIVIFLFTFLYSLLRPSSNVFSKLFLIFGSVLGFLSVIGDVYVIQIANFLGVGRGTDLFLYIGLLVIFFFIFYTLDRLNKIQKKITVLSRKISLKDFKSDNK